MNGRFRVWALKRWTGFGSTRIKPIAGFCTTKKDSKAAEVEASLTHYHDSYRQLENLDFMTAAKIAFSDPPVKKKKFGLDFHLVQLFFVLMPSFAVYLVAQYARYEMRKMEAELELKKKKEDEEKAKQAELDEAAEREKMRSSPEFVEVRTRLDKLEEAMKGIAVESKKKNKQQHQVGGSNDKKQATEEDAGKEEQASESSPPPR